MKLIYVTPDQLTVSPELSRSRTSKVFAERLQASIQEMGLAEPLKVAPLPSDKYLIVDGILRWQAIQALRAVDETLFETIPAYIVDPQRRFEIRYQTDIYQDLLPSQLAMLVEYLHEAEQVRKIDIARYIGVSPATLRNYTGLWRLIERGGLFQRIVELMDVGVLPASNPYAWLRLTRRGLECVLDVSFTDGDGLDEWIDGRIARARRGDVAPYSLKYIEAATGSVPADLYREAEDVRTMKRDLGLRRAAAVAKSVPTDEARRVMDNLVRVSEQAHDRVLRVAARSLTAYLQ